MLFYNKNILSKQRNKSLYYLILTRASIPDDVEEAILGSKVSLNFPDLLPYKNIKILSSSLQNFDFKISNLNLFLLGIVSDSTIYNTSSFFISIFLMFIIHFFISLLYLFASRCTGATDCCCLIKISKYLITKAFQILTFAFYIRSVLEMTQIILISMNL